MIRNISNLGVNVVTDVSHTVFSYLFIQSGNYICNELDTEKDVLKISENFLLFRETGARSGR